MVATATTLNTSFTHIFMSKILEELGLSQNESKIYSFLLSSGSSTAGEIINKIKIHRRNTYDALARLIDKGLLSETIQDNKRYYEATSPEYLVSLIQEKFEVAQQELPSLMSVYEKSKSRQQVKVLQGVAGMRACWEDMVRNADYLYLLGATGLQYEYLRVYTPKWIKALNEKKIDMKVLWNSDAKHLDYFLKEWDVKSKKLPSNFITKTQIFLYSNKSAIVIWSKEPLAILIESKEINEGFKKYFQFIWKISRRIQIPN